MPRTARLAPGGTIFHVLSRANARARIFAKDGDYAAFERVLSETLERKPMRILGYLVMPNHFHMVLWPERDGDLAAFMQRLTTTHVRRWNLHRRTVGCGHLYQGATKKEDGGKAMDQSEGWRQNAGISLRNSGMNFQGRPRMSELRELVPACIFPERHDNV